MKLKFFLLNIFLLSSMNLSGKTFNYNEIHKMPKGVEKDYYIWRFLSQNDTTPPEAKSIIQDASHLNTKLQASYQKITGQKAKLSRLKASPYEIERYESRRTQWNTQADANKQFKEGLSLLRRGKPLLAASYFDLAEQTYIKRRDKDKALFWLYQSNKKKIFLEKLNTSYHPNIYTLLAADILGQRYPKTITETLPSTYLFGFDESDPLIWAEVKQKMNEKNTNLDDLADDYKSQKSIGIHTYLKAKASKHTKAYFPMPYRDTLKHLDKKRQAIIYAIIRQETRFVPASVSRSFALGLMQFMPFLVRHVAKQKNEKIDYDDMFKPKKALEYANFHLDYLDKWLYHPLFVAYAYNGGIGFTKKLIKNRKNFKRGKYEPYMSMEVIENAEAREYGKKVLSNYVIYLNKLGISTRLLPYMKILFDPKQTDRFR